MNKIFWKKIHNVLGLTSASFLLLLLATGILLNHPSWLKTNNPTVAAAHPQIVGKIYQGKKDGLFVSEDGGKTWEEVPMLRPPQNVAGIEFYENEIYVIEKWGRLMGSSDGGKVWRNIEIPFDPQSLGIELKRFSRGAGGLLCLYTSHGWLDSADGGKTWDESHFHKDSRPLDRLILTIHNGYFFGPQFVWLYDFSAWALLILIVSGVILWKAGRTAA